MKKNLIFSSLLFSGILISCGKSDIKTIKTTDASSSDETVLRLGNGEPDEELMRVWYHDGSRPGVEGATFGCFGVGGYCTKKNSRLVPTSTHISVIGTIIAEGEDHYADNFHTFHSELDELFDNSLVDGVADGTVQLEIFGSISDETNAYFKFEKEGQTISVAPIGL